MLPPHPCHWDNTTVDLHTKCSSRRRNRFCCGYRLGLWKDLHRNTLMYGLPLCATSLYNRNYKREPSFTWYNVTGEVLRLKELLTLFRKKQNLRKMNPEFSLIGTIPFFPPFSFACWKHYWKFITIPVI